ncbi:hypothetical protein A0U40_13370 [[Bacillus] sp. KCTC 13219]|nr:hypothetical protein A0U40_13370 [[Bacillus] sp. KCTC 13219]
MSVQKTSFTDLEKIRLDILNEKIKQGLEEFNQQLSIQWTALKLEKPLLETLSKILSENESLKVEIDYWKAIAESCECNDDC